MTPAPRCVLLGRNSGTPAEDTKGVGDWQQTAVSRQEYTQLRLVHMLARKPR